MDAPNTMLFVLCLKDRHCLSQKWNKNIISGGICIPVICMWCGWQVYNDERAHRWANRTILQQAWLLRPRPKPRAFLWAEHNALCGHEWEGTACDKVKHCQGSRHVMNVLFLSHIWIYHVTIDMKQTHINTLCSWWWSAKTADDVAVNWLEEVAVKHQY